MNGSFRPGSCGTGRGTYTWRWPGITLCSCDLVTEKLVMEVYCGLVAGSLNTGLCRDLVADFVTDLGRDMLLQVNRDLL